MRKLSWKIPRMTTSSIGMVMPNSTSAWPRQRRFVARVCPGLAYDRLDMGPPVPSVGKGLVLHRRGDLQRDDAVAADEWPQHRVDQLRSMRDGDLDDVVVVPRAGFVGRDVPELDVAVVDRDSRREIVHDLPDRVLARELAARIRRIVHLLSRDRVPRRLGDAILER